MTDFCRGRSLTFLQARKVVPEVLLPTSLLALRPPGSEPPLSSAAGNDAAPGSSEAESSSRSGSPAHESLRATPASASPELAASAASADSPPGEAAPEITGGSAEAAETSGNRPAEYPPLRRAQRLSYALATALQKDFSHADGRQVCSVPSVAAACMPDT